MYTRDKNAKHKTHDDEKSRRKKYVRTRKFQIKGEMDKPCAPYGCGQNGQKTKGTELDRKKEKDIHAKSTIIPILINSTHFHKQTSL